MFFFFNKSELNHVYFLDQIEAKINHIKVYGSIISTNASLTL